MLKLFPDNFISHLTTV